jgi:hypothetical protein
MLHPGVMCNRRNGVMERDCDQKRETQDRYAQD